MDPSGEDDPSPVLLRWSDVPGGNPREESVQVVDAHLSEAVVSSPIEFVSETPVNLVGFGHIEKGVVRFCRAEGAKFILTISLHPNHPHPLVLSERDPGVFAVENFITEEQELLILQELEEELSRAQKPSASGALPSRSASSHA
jgi:hypothetical protein